ncbi:MAG: DUF3788 family protein [Leptolinea sp.]|jgi:hypothetical protein|nr:DUF3788 family protein [Leptolinea sp.]
MDKKPRPELRDENIFPDENILKDTLGDTYSAYQALLKLFDENGMVYGWRYYHDGNMWLNKVQKKDKTIVWMSAWKGYAQATIYFPEKHIEKIYTLDISEERKEIIRSAPNTGKSKPCTFQIRSTDVLDDFNKLMKLKMTLK